MVLVPESMRSSVRVPVGGVVTRSISGGLKPLPQMNSIWPLAIFGKAHQNMEGRILQYTLHVLHYPASHLQSVVAGQTTTCGQVRSCPTMTGRAGGLQWECLESSACCMLSERQRPRLFKGSPCSWGSCFTIVFETLTYINSSGLSQTVTSKRRG